MIVLFPAIAFGQTDYYMKDTLVAVGIKLVDNGNLENSKFCQVKNKKGIIKYSPDEIDEYGFKDGRVYVSKEIQVSDSVKKFFLLRLAEGETTLYSLSGTGKKRFFIEKDSSKLFELQKFDPENDHRSFNDYLVGFSSDCPQVNDAAKLVSYNNGSLTKFIRRYNNCDGRPFPHFKYGAMLGLELTRLIPTSVEENAYLKLFDFKYDAGYSFGLFIDHPILVSDFSLHLEAYYSQHRFQLYQHSNGNDYDFAGNLSSIKVPLMIRYTYPTNKIRPFLNAGGIFSFAIENRYSIYEATIGEGVIEIDRINESPQFDTSQMGYTLGAGIEYKLNYRQSLFFELRTNKLYGFSGPKALNSSEIYFTTGINF